MKTKRIEINFSNINSLLELHNILMLKFGFPDFYGRNGNALIDCWVDLRVEGDKETSMCDVYIEPDEIVGLWAKNISRKNELIINELLIAIEETNKRSIEFFSIPSIYLIPM